MRWEKQGLIFVPNGEHSWARTHAHLPTIDVLDEDTLRIYFASLDENNYGRIGFVDVSSDNPSRIIQASDKPVLDVGQLGTFDDCGVVPSCIISINDKKYLYYVGFQRATRVPYMLFTGLAIQEQNELIFERYTRTPILDRYPKEPFSRAAPFIIYDGNVFKMWYWSCLDWSSRDKVVHYNNVIRYAISIDGIYWNVHPNICIAPDFKDEFSIGRPCVIQDNQLYKMWYSVRSFTKHYVIGYAESLDGISWERKDHMANIAPSRHGWDSEMVCYPVVINIKNRTYMFYNGNRHGASGFGYAVLSD